MEKKKSTKGLLLVMGELILAQFLLTICTIQKPYFIQLLLAAVLLFVILYGFWLYKKPHGNMLKYTLLLFTGYKGMADVALVSAMGFNVWLYYADILAVVIVAYCSGRLDRLEKNKILLILADFVFLGSSIITVITDTGSSTLAKCGFFNAPIVLTTLLIAYFSRYSEHKQAGENT